MILSEKEQCAINVLVNKGNDLLNTPVKTLNFTNDPVIDYYLNDLDNYPHFFVLACVMDRQMKTDKVWKIPFYFSKVIGKPDLNSFSNFALNEVEEIFQIYNLHRSNKIMASYFYKAVQKIKDNYNCDASLIWKDDLSCETVLERFLEFEGVCINTAYKAISLLIKEFKISMTDKTCIDISPDVHSKRVFTRLGFIEKNPTNTELINCARALFPEYPGIFDLPLGEIGREWCRANNPDCNNCYMSVHCKKKNVRTFIVNDHVINESRL